MPVSEIVCVVPGKLRELSVTVADPVSVPVAVGLNVMRRAQLNPAPRKVVSVQSLSKPVSCLKSPDKLKPVNSMC